MNFTGGLHPTCPSIRESPRLTRSCKAGHRKKKTDSQGAEPAFFYMRRASAGAQMMRLRRKPQPLRAKNLDSGAPVPILAIPEQNFTCLPKEILIVHI